MDRTQLLQHFDTLAETPEAVAKLRHLVVELAARGVFGGAGAKSVLLGTEAQFVMGQAPPGTECNTNGDGTIFVKAGEFGVLYPEVCCWTTKPLKFAKKGDVLICVVGATVGKLNLAIDSAIGRSVAAIRPSERLDTRYLYYTLMPFTLRLRGASRGSAQGVIGKQELNAVKILLPPLAEQRRIVAKVEELLALCNELEARQTAARDQRTLLVRSALDRLTTAQTEPEFRQHAAFVLRHSDLVLDSVSDLRQAVLSLACEGRLVPQRSGEIAHGLLVKIQAQKKRLENEGIIKTTKPLPPIEKEELEHLVPDNWVWARLGDICELITDGTHLTPKYTDTGRMFLSAQNVKPFRFIPGKHRFVSEEDYQGYTKNRKPEFGDILLTRVGAGIGEAAVIDQHLDFAIYVSVALVRPTKGLIDPSYITLWLNSPHGTGKSRRFTYGVGMSQGNLNLGQIQKFVVPLPPLAEQKQIVAKVDELMRWCDALEARLAAAQTAARILLDATLHEILAA